MHSFAAPLPAVVLGAAASLASTAGTLNAAPTAAAALLALSTLALAAAILAFPASTTTGPAPAPRGSGCPHAPAHAVAFPSSSTPTHRHPTILPPCPCLRHGDASALAVLTHILTSPPAAHPRVISFPANNFSPLAGRHLAAAVAANAAAGGTTLSELRLDARGIGAEALEALCDAVVAHGRVRRLVVDGVDGDGGGFAAVARAAAAVVRLEASAVAAALGGNGRRLGVLEIDVPVGPAGDAAVMVIAAEGLSRATALGLRRVRVGGVRSRGAVAAVLAALAGHGTVESVRVICGRGDVGTSDDGDDGGGGAVGRAAAALILGGGAHVRQLQVCGVRLSARDVSFIAAVVGGSALEELRLDGAALPRDAAPALAAVVRAGGVLRSVAAAGNRFDCAGVMMVLSAAAEAGSTLRALDTSAAAASLLARMRLARLYFLPVLAPRPQWFDDDDDNNDEDDPDASHSSVEAVHYAAPLSGVPAGGHTLVDSDVLEWYPSPAATSTAAPTTTTAFSATTAVVAARYAPCKPLTHQPTAIPRLVHLFPHPSPLAAALAQRRLRAAQTLQAMGRHLLRLSVGGGGGWGGGRWRLVVASGLGEAILLSAVDEGDAGAVMAAASGVRELFAARELRAMVRAVMSRGSIGRLCLAGANGDDGVEPLFAFDAWSFSSACRAYVDCCDFV
ncbi:hypothetical protein DFJ73DRAFT_963892 [Zopfochytrium polystomum]|nr:hypothetical protein DFJ73DRAFT_963892 [Zopfochytrium polystomum]